MSNLQIEKNKYFQTEKIYNAYENDEDFINFFKLFDEQISKSYRPGPWGGAQMLDLTLGFDDVVKITDILIFVLDNYELSKHKSEFLNEVAFENPFHKYKVSRREAILSSGLYYLIEGNKELKKQIDNSKYFNICLHYLESYFNYGIEYYKKGIKSKGKLKELSEEMLEQYILGELLYDVPFWDNIYFGCNGDQEWFCTGEYMQYVKINK